MADVAATNCYLPRILPLSGAEKCRSTFFTAPHPRMRSSILLMASLREPSARSSLPSNSVRHSWSLGLARQQDQSADASEAPPHGFPLDGARRSTSVLAHGPSDRLAVPMKDALPSRFLTQAVQHRIAAAPRRETFGVSAPGRRTASATSCPWRRWSFTFNGFAV